MKPSVPASRMLGLPTLLRRDTSQATLVLDQPFDSDYTYREESWDPKSVRVSVTTDKGEGLGDLEDHHQGVFAGFG